MSGKATAMQGVHMHMLEADTDADADEEGEAREGGNVFKNKELIGRGVIAPY